ncbi:type I-B CRISPR-associated endonuclease Cas1 [bacterium]|nr:MAG: type I-B CRISPR-associated endonuclease Cas1 [bacterium]
MKRPYYIFSSGRLQRHQNTLYLRQYTDPNDDHSPPELEDAAFHSGCLLEDLDDQLAEFDFDEGPYQPRPTLAKRPIAINDIEAIYLFGEADLNARCFNFLGRSRVPIHFFNYYGFYTGSYWPRQEVVSGFLTVKQALLYAHESKRTALARSLVDGASSNILKNLKYYNSPSRSKDVLTFITDIEHLRAQLPAAPDVENVMGLEGAIRAAYYKAWPNIFSQPWAEFQKRVKRPPDNPINALVSFGNSLCYTLVLSEIYRTALNPTLSVLHQPGARRFSLALDIAEIFKPILVDRLIWKLVNNGELAPRHFDESLNFCYLKESGRKIFVEAWEERLRTTIDHRNLKRRVSYRHLVRLECYKLQRHLLEIEPYDPFKIWW